MVYDTAKVLANELKNSVEYREYTAVKARAMENNTTRALIDEYNKLQIQAQAAMIAGDRESESLKKLQIDNQAEFFFIKNRNKYA